MQCSPIVQLLFFFYPSVCHLLSPDPGLLSQGRSHLLRAQELAQHPRYGTCWMRALGQLNGGCRKLDEEQQSLIALAFAHCHLQRSGREFPHCEMGSSIRDCTQHMDPVAFGVYTEFFTHAHSICYFLHNEAWQQQAHDTVHRLTSSSEAVAHQLEITSRLAEETARAQNATLRSQEQIIKAGEILRQTFHDSSQGFHQAFRELQDSATEQRVIFAEIFSRMTFLHRFVVGESNALYSVLFHILSGIATLLLTSSRQTAGARLLLLTLVGANIYLERVICNLLLENAEEGYDLTESFSFWVGLSRRIAAGLGITILAYFIWTYKDPTRQNQEVLRNLQETRKEIQHLVQEVERLWARPELLLKGAEPRTEEIFSDLSVPEVFTKEMRAETHPKEHCASNQHKETWPSSPKQPVQSSPRTHRSLSRRHRQPQNIATQVIIPIPLDRTPRYNLRSRQSLQDLNPSMCY